MYNYTLEQEHWRNSILAHKGHNRGTYPGLEVGAGDVGIQGRSPWLWGTETRPKGKEVVDKGE